MNSLIIFLVVLAILSVVGYLILTSVPEKVDKEEEVSKIEDKPALEILVKDIVPVSTEVSTPVSTLTSTPTSTPVSTPEPAPTQPQEPQYSVFLNTDYAGHDIGIGKIGSLQSCKKSCDENPKCNGFVIDQAENKYQCWLKNIPLTAKPRYNTKWSTYYKGTPPTAGAATAPVV